jgi:hypothetical protein
MIMVKLNYINLQGIFKMLASLVKIAEGDKMADYVTYPIHAV